METLVLRKTKAALFEVENTYLACYAWAVVLVLLLLFIQNYIY